MNGSDRNNSGSQFMTVVGKLGLKNKSLSKKKTADSPLQANKLEIWTVDNKIIPVDLNRIRLTKGKDTDVLVRVSVLHFHILNFVQNLSVFVVIWRKSQIRYVCIVRPTHFLS